MFHADETHFAVNDLPQPGTPVNNNPFGGEIPKDFALASKQ